LLSTAQAPAIHLSQWQYLRIFPSRCHGGSDPILFIISNRRTELRTFTKSLLTAAFLGGTALALPLASQAQVSLRLTQIGGNTVTIADNGALDDNSSVGIINVDVNSAAFAALFPQLDPTNTTIGTSYNVSANVATLQSNATLAINVAGPLTFTVETTDVGINGPNQPPKNETSSSAYTWNLQPVGETSTFRSFVDTTNVAFGNTNSSTTETGINNSPNSGSAAAIGSGFAFLDPNIYSFSSISTINVTGTTGTAQAIGNARIVGTIVPEPGSIAMLIGMGISGSAFVLRRRRSK
jgi:hypothetical protein